METPVHRTKGEEKGEGARVILYACCSSACIGGLGAKGVAFVRYVDRERDSQGTFGIDSGWKSLRQI